MFESCRWHELWKEASLTFFLCGCPNRHVANFFIIYIDWDVSQSRSLKKMQNWPICTLKRFSQDKHVVKKGYRNISAKTDQCGHWTAIQEDFWGTFKHVDYSTTGFCQSLPGGWCWETRQRQLWQFWGKQHVSTIDLNPPPCCRARTQSPFPEQKTSHLGCWAVCGRWSCTRGWSSDRSSSSLTGSKHTIRQCAECWLPMLCV